MYKLFPDHWKSYFQTVGNSVALGPDNESSASGYNWFKLSGDKCFESKSRITVVDTMFDLLTVNLKHILQSLNR